MMGFAGSDFNVNIKSLVSFEGFVIKYICDTKSLWADRFRIRQERVIQIMLLKAFL